MDDAVAPFIPEFSAARAAGLEAERQLGLLPIKTDLLAAPPDREDRLAVVIVDAQVLRRDTADKKLQLPESRIETLPKHPPPAQWPVERRVMHVVGQDTWLSDCETCEFERGKQECRTCSTQGYVLIASGDTTLRDECPGCAGKGWVDCTTCGGEGHARWVQLVETTDAIHRLRYAYVPSMTDALDLAVGAHFENLTFELPDVLRIQLDPREQRSAYRGSTGQVKEAFQGHLYGDALDRARGGLAGLRHGGEVIHEEVRAYAWPLLWLSYDSLTRKGEVVLLRHPERAELTAVTVEA